MPSRKVYKVTDFKHGYKYFPPEASWIYHPVTTIIRDHPLNHLTHLQGLQGTACFGSFLRGEGGVAVLALKMH